MNHSTIVFLINDSVRAVQGVYEDIHGAKPEVFKTLDPSVSVDDLIVVQSTTRHEMTVVKVTEVDVEIDLDTEAKIKWVVQRIDQGGFSKIIEQENEAISAVHSAERKRKKDELRKAVFADQTDRINALQLANHKEDDGDVMEPPEYPE
jgi:hypothetical protein